MICGKLVELHSRNSDVQPGMYMACRAMDSSGPQDTTHGTASLADAATKASVEALAPLALGVDLAPANAQHHGRL